MSVTTRTLAVMPGRQEIFVRRADHCDVRDDVLHDLGGFSNLRHAAAKGLARKRIDRKRRLLPDPNTADLGLVDRCVYLHPPQILGDDEKLRRLQTRSDGLPGSTDFFTTVPSTGARISVRSIDPRLRKLGFALLDDSFGICDLGIGDLELGFL